MKIKIIDLLSLIYEKKAPKRINVIYGRTTESYKFNERLNWYETLDETTLFGFPNGNDLSLEVEIIEERPKEIEKDIYNRHFREDGRCIVESKGHDYDFPYYYVEIIDELIDIANYLLKKEDIK